jgi:hypothetical protein
VLLDPSFCPISEWTKKKDGSFVVDQNIGNRLNSLRRTHLDACSFAASHAPERAKEMPPASAANVSLEISRYEFPRHIQPCG